MPAAPIPHDEPERLAALQRLGLTDARPDPALERIAGLARSLFRARSGWVTMVTSDRVVVRTESGAAHQDIARDDAFSAHVILDDKVLWIEDARLDARFADHHWVTGKPRIRFCAGAPIVSPNGFKLGAVCVFDPEPRAYDEEAAERLTALADIVGDQCRLRQARAHLSLDADTQAAANGAVEALVNEAPVMIALIDRDLRLVQASPRFLADYGQGAERLIGQSIASFLPDTSRIEEVAARCLAGERIVGEAMRHVTADGRKVARDWEVSPWRDRSGAIVGAVLLSNDVTELYRTRARAQHAEDRLTRALHVSDTLVWELNLRDHKLRSSGDAARFMDRPVNPRELMTGLSAIVHPLDQPSVKTAWDDLVQHGESYRVEHRMNRRDGRETWVMSDADLFHDAAGRPERIIGTLRDITDRKRQELALAAARLEAEAADRAKSEFLANMSHEIRTPLNGVVGVAGALKRTPLSPAQQEMVKLIESSGRVLERLLGDVLDLARVEAGGLQMRAEPFEPGRLAREVCALFEPAARDKGLAFRLSLPSEALGLVGDALRVRQILSNLCSNAVKFTERGAIALSMTQEPGSGGRMLLRVAVEDTGIGFDAAIKSRLFERFQQADGSITRRYGGSGLGLAISRALAEQMGGRLEASSEPGRGSVFSFVVELPRAEPMTAPDEVLEAEVAPERTLRVLLAEDHEINRQVVQLILGAAGVDLKMAVDGTEAVAAFEANSFDLILMDMQMPVMDGLSAIRAIRAMERRRGQARTPIVVLTANALPEHVTASHEAGADDHLTKPIVADTLLRLVGSIAVAEDDAAPMRLSA